MASPEVAIPQANGVAAAPSRPDSPMSINSSTKRKRDESEDSTGGLNGSQITKPLPNGFYKPQDQKVIIRDFYHVLQRYATPPLGDLLFSMPFILSILPPSMTGLLVTHYQSVCLVAFPALYLLRHDDSLTSFAGIASTATS